MFVPDTRRKYDWPKIREYYEAGHSPAVCQAAFGVSNGAWHHAVARGEIQLRPADQKQRPRGATRQQVADLLSDGLTPAEIARRLRISRPTVCFHMRRLGIPPRSELAARYDWSAISAFYDAGHSMRQCMRRFGFSSKAWSDAIERGEIVPRPRAKPTPLVLVEGSRYNRHHLKNRLLVEGLKRERCELCGLFEWCGRPVALELHHVNGDRCDNRLENLQLLCPNCHSQTDTWGGRNKSRRDRLRSV